jgi:hypothetical protein
MPAIQASFLNTGGCTAEIESCFPGVAECSFSFTFSCKPEISVSLSRPCG